MKDDPIVAEVRRIRHEIEKELGDDPVRIADYIQKIQREFKGRLYSGKPRPLQKTRVA